MSPSLERFAVLLDDPAVDSLDAVIASWFLPPLGKLRKLRAEIRQPLLLETEYHLALASFLTFEQSGLIQAWDRAQKLRRSRLQRRARSGPERDLQFLAISLEINALSRLAENVVYPDVIRYRSREGLDESINPSLQMFSTGLDWKDIPLNKLVRGLPGEVAAAVRTALGLLIRRERREKPERRHRSFDPTPEDKIFEEIQHYRASLDLHESSTPHCYLAECLIELDRKAEAIAHVKQALLLAPLHRLARELEVKLGTTRDPAT